MCVRVYFLSSIHFHSPSIIWCDDYKLVASTMGICHKRLSSSYLHFAHTPHNRILKLNIDGGKQQAVSGIHTCIYGFVAVVHWLFCCLLVHSLTPSTPTCYSLLRIYSRHTHTAHICYWIYYGVLRATATIVYIWMKHFVLLPGYLFVHARSMTRMKKTWHSHTHMCTFSVCVLLRVNIFFLS